MARTCCCLCRPACCQACASVSSPLSMRSTPGQTCPLTQIWTPNALAGPPPRNRQPRSCPPEATLKNAGGTWISSHKRKRDALCARCTLRPELQSLLTLKTWQQEHSCKINKRYNTPEMLINKQRSEIKYFK
eukprot:897849-Pyramimonas_sp.AAC.2